VRSCKKSTGVILTILFSLGILVRGRVAEAAPADDAYASAQASFRELKSLSEEKRRFRHHWQGAIDKFKAVAGEISEVERGRRRALHRRPALL
jgi:hypothetical protein